jgi:hypothetical protein
VPIELKLSDELFRCAETLLQSATFLSNRMNVGLDIVQHVEIVIGWQMQHLGAYEHQISLDIPGSGIGEGFCGHFATPIR